MVALYCSQAPEGYAKGPLRLVANKMVELQDVDKISHVSIRQIQKNELKLWMSQGWVIPPKQNGKLSAWMKVILDVYKRLYN